MLINNLKNEIYNHIFEKEPDNQNKLYNMFKINSENLDKNGDIVLNIDFNKNEIINNIENLIEKSNKWKIPIIKINIKNEKYLLYLNRQSAMKEIFTLVLENNSPYGKFDLPNNFNFKNKNIYDPNEDISLVRSKLIGLTAKNIVDFSKKANNSPIKKQISVSFANNIPKEKDENEILVICGIVTDATTKKRSTNTCNDYYLSRRSDMQLMAMHKYGVRINDNAFFKKFLDNLGKAAVIIDLLEVKHSSPVKLVKSSQGCSKGASFIMYNCARVETLLDTFLERVNKSFYTTLPPLEEIDLSNLKEPEEWQIVFNYIMLFPEILQQVIIDLEHGKCQTHLIPKFLSGLSSLFSVYYRRCKILVDNRQHLFELMFARIYLLKCIQDVFRICLQILDIEPIKKM